MGREKRYNDVRKVSVKMDANQHNILNWYTTKLGFPSLSQLIKACINKGLPLVKQERNGQGE